MDKAKSVVTKVNPYNPDHQDSNMYGFITCPKCGSKYRCAFVNKPGIVQCDDCGFEEPYAVVPNDVEEDIKE